MSSPSEYPQPEPNDITRRFQEWRDGRQESLDDLFALIYRDLRRMAHGFMRRERADQTLQATDLVHEAYLRMFQGEPFDWQNRKHMFCSIAQAMRHVLVDHARAHKAEKRGGEARKLSLDDALVIADDRFSELLCLNSALEKLAGLNPRQAEVVHLRYFAGLTLEETGAVLDVSPETVKLDWRFAKAWLQKEIGEGAGP
jgi:RNA polymerase sigma factor (TIGR02999 family)